MITGAGLGFTLARTWPETTRDREDLLKHIGDARRFCPECGVKPRQEPAVVMPERRRSLYELERDGTWLDGTPLPQITTYPAPAAPLAAASREENQMFGRQRRAAAREEAAQQAEADRLFSLADELERQVGERPDYRREITAERAARIRRELGKDIASEAAAQAAESRLEGADLDAEIDRLAGQFPEPLPADEVVAPGDEPGVDAARWVPGQERGDLEVAELLLSRHAAEAEDAFRRERRAIADEQFAQLAHDLHALSQSRQDASCARADREAATADAYAAAESLQRSALGPEPEDADSIYQHAGGYIGRSLGATGRMAQHQLEAG